MHSSVEINRTTMCHHMSLIESAQLVRKKHMCIYMQNNWEFNAPNCNLSTYSSCGLYAIQ